MRRALAATCAWLTLMSGPPAAMAGDWSRFEGRLSATGERQTLPTEGGRPAAIVRLSGTLILTGGDGLSRGFRCEAIGYDDGSTVRAGRAVWTDHRSDRIYSTMEGGPLQSGGRIRGRFTGGTGRYEGLTGEYEFTWQFVVSAEGTVQGHATDVRGRFRRDPVSP